MTRAPPTWAQVDFLEREIEILRRRLEREREQTLYECAEFIREQAEAYPVVIWPDVSTSIDGVSARMARHCARVWPEKMLDELKRR